LDLIFEVSEEGARERNKVLVVVEVRARAFGAMVDGIESIGPKKLQRIQKSIRHFLIRYEGPAESVRLDVLAWDERDWVHIPGLWA
jgi:Holliday junction resolvase-like predicted endonuclease